MAITAKVKLDRKREIDGDQVELWISPDYQDGRNREWAEATPNLSLNMTVKGDVADSFGEVGDRFTLTFEKVGREDAADGGGEQE